MLCCVCECRCEKIQSSRADRVPVFFLLGRETSRKMEDRRRVFASSMQRIFVPLSVCISIHKPRFAGACSYMRRRVNVRTSPSVSRTCNHLTPRVNVITCPSLSRIIGYSRAFPFSPLSARQNRAVLSSFVSVVFSFLFSKFDALAGCLRRVLSVIHRRMSATCRRSDNGGKITAVFLSDSVRPVGAFMTLCSTHDLTIF